MHGFHGHDLLTLAMGFEVEFQIRFFRRHSIWKDGWPDSTYFWRELGLIGRSPKPMRHFARNGGLKFFRVHQQAGHAGEQAARRAAVQHAMVEAQRKRRFDDRHKLTFGFLPVRRFATRAETEHQGLFR